MGLSRCQSNNPPLIILAKIGWLWSNIVFGFRFSNLTHRGIITNGPFRFTKHPSYIYKNISWWLLSTPFPSLLGGTETVRYCMALVLVNILYLLRARAEEHHLSQDPIYVQYALWINENGIFRQASKILPFLKYRPPSGVNYGNKTVD